MPLKRILALFLCCLLLVGCGMFPEEETLPSAPTAEEVEDATYTMTTVARGDVTVTDTIRAVYKPAVTESLRFTLEGEAIGTIYVQVGDTVSAGDVLAELDLGTMEDTLEDEQYTLEVLELELEHLKEQQDLAVRKAEYALSQASTDEEEESLEEALAQVEAQYAESLQEAEDAVTIQKLRVEETEAELDARRLTASIDGTVTYVREYSDGAVSSSGDIVVTVSDTASSVFLVDDEEAAYFAVGDSVTLVYDDEEHAATVVDPLTIGIEPEEETAYITLDETDPSLESGTKAQITLTLEASYDVLFVQSSAIKTVDGETVVYYLDDEDVKCMKTVETGLDNGSYVEIISGLEEGEEIIAE